MSNCTTVARREPVLVYTVKGRELAVLQQLAAAARQAQQRFQASLQFVASRESLPAGATFDVGTGEFYS